MEKDRLRMLLIKYAADAANKEEVEELLDEIAYHRIHPELEELMAQILEKTEVDSSSDPNGEALYQRIVSHRRFTPRKKVHQIRNWWWYGSAAVLLLAFSIWIAEWRVSQNDYGQYGTEVTRTVTVAPSDRPLLRLADGRVVDLDSVSDGLLAIEGGIQITLKDDVLHYQGKPRGINPDVPLNTITIPKGRQYQIALPDGSKLWLNAASRVTYPVVFDSARREVDIEGEVYFEVEHAVDWPFVVMTPMQRVEVLGTKFNVSAYRDDIYTKTTLLKGSVKVSSLPNSAGSMDEPIDLAILKPGQQGVTNIGDGRFSVNSVDPADIVSWKENLFVFSNEEISEVMKKISRWYNVEIEYKDGMAGKRIGGSIPILGQVEELMDALKDTGLLHYEMRGGTIVIMK